MAKTNFDLGDHWDRFIRRQVDSGRYDSASDVLREALRALEIREAKLAVLISHLEEGGDADGPGRLFEDLTIERLIEDLDAELQMDASGQSKH